MSFFLLRMLRLPLAGITFTEALVYEICFKPLDLFHHSNVRIPQKLDHCLRFLIVSPHMHRLHHSSFQEETDSNYASFFSFWDRLGGTLKSGDNEKITYGLEEFKAPALQTFWGMLKTPFISFQK